MNYDLAIKEFQALIEEVQQERAKAVTTITNVPIPAEELIQRCEILVNNFYPTDDYGSTPFTVPIKTLYNSVHNASTKLNRLQTLLQNILKDVKLKKSIADDKGKEKEKAQERELININNDMRLVTNQVSEFRILVAAKMKELEELKQGKQKEIDRIRNDYQNQIDTIKDTYQKEIDRLRNAPRGFNYKISFHIILFLFLSLLNFGLPYTLGTMNWKYIIGIELAIIISVLVFYYRNVPGWIQFLVTTVLAIFAILSS